MTFIAVIDYGMGNLHSACKGLEKAGGTPKITDSPLDIEASDAVILPGVGAFDPAVQHIRSRHLEKPIKAAIASGKPFLGICLGLQILFDASEEGSEPGLGIISGTVRRFQSQPDLTIPHMGWNALQLTQPHHPLWQNLPPNAYVYFVHSYYVDPVEVKVKAATVTHGSQTITAAIAHNNLVAVQFHPEKSADNGLKILANFVSRVREKSGCLEYKKQFMNQQYVEKWDEGYWIFGTRVSLDSVILAFLDGLSPEMIATECFPTLRLEQVYGAITYYLAHRTEIDAYLQQADTEFAALHQATRNADPNFYEKLIQVRLRTS